MQKFSAFFILVSIVFSLSACSVADETKGHLNLVNNTDSDTLSQLYIWPFSTDENNDDILSSEIVSGQSNFILNITPGMYNLRVVSKTGKNSSTIKTFSAGETNTWTVSSVN